jgi:hypothetical protein
MVPLDERFQSGIRDPHARDLGRLAAGGDALGLCGSQPGIHQLDHLRDGEPVREHHRFGAAVAAGGKQFERAAAAGATTYTTRKRRLSSITRAPCCRVTEMPGQRWQAAR